MNCWLRKDGTMSCIRIRVGFELEKMRILRKTHATKEDNSTFTHRETYDGNGNVIYSADYRIDPIVENRFEFNPKNQLDNLVKFECRRELFCFS